MASKETQELIVEAINFYMENVCDPAERPDMEVMRKLVKLDDIKKGLEKKGDDE